MRIIDTPLQDLKIAETDLRGDNRGALSRFFCKEELSSAFGNRDILQINFSMTGKKGTLRGMHFQHAPSAEMKLIRCLKGRVFDVAVDLRVTSPTFMKWHAKELSADNRDMFIIPEGFAHGFQALEDNCELLYLHTEAYDQPNEGGARYDDPALAIEWPLPVAEISDRDLNHPLITKDFKGIRL